LFFSFLLYKTSSNQNCTKPPPIKIQSNYTKFYEIQPKFFLLRLNFKTLHMIPWLPWFVGNQQASWGPTLPLRPTPPWAGCSPRDANTCGHMMEWASKWPFYTKILNSCKDSMQVRYLPRLHDSSETLASALFLFLRLLSKRRQWRSYTAIPCH
jgi:hypothetical protein